MADFAYSPMFPTTADSTEYELVSSDHVRLVEMEGETFLRVDPEGLTLLAERAFYLHYGGYHWPAFNVADMAISAGAVIILAALLFDNESRQRRGGRS